MKMSELFKETARELGLGDEQQMAPAASTVPEMMALDVPEEEVEQWRALLRREAPKILAECLADPAAVIRQNRRRAAQN